MIDVLVISHACATAINRVPYRRLAALGWSVEIVTAARIELPDLVRDADPPQSDDPPLHLLRMRAGLPRFWTFDGLRKVLLARRPRIVLLDYDPGSRLALEVGWTLPSAKIVCFSYDNMPRTVVGEIRKRAWAGVARVAVIKALSSIASTVVDHVWVLSNDSALAVEALGYHGRVSRIPLGFDPDLFRPDEAVRARIRSDLGLHHITFAYFGRLVPEKGVDLLIRALHQLRDRSWQMLLDQFGEYPHPYERELQRLIADLDLQDRVVFFDAPHDRVADYMQAADVVVMPSIANDRWKEQYGRVAPEAMACGKLVIATDSGALPELVGDAGIIVPHSSVNAIAEAARRVLDDRSLLTHCANSARERAISQFSLPVQVREMQQLFSRWAKPS